MCTRTVAVRSTRSQSKRSRGSGNPSRGPGKPWLSPCVLVILKDIETTAPPFATRHASTIAAVLLVMSVSASVATLWVDRTGARAGQLLNDPSTTVSELLCFGVVGAVLIARRPDLPFGWILGLGAAADIALVGIGVPSLALAYRGHESQFLAWGVGLGVLQWVPTALNGIVNVRFPSGRPSNRLGHLLDRALCAGIPVALVGSSTAPG
jgi:two-component system NarL family sensor kinase